MSIEAPGGYGRRRIRRRPSIRDGARSRRQDAPPVGGVRAARGEIMEAQQTPDPDSGERPRIALCLSGGGYRAAAFHLGALRRLHETGLLAIVDHVSSVSGGSILAAHLAQCMVEKGRSTLRFDDWERDVAETFRDRILRRDIRTLPILVQWCLPWNWFRSGPGAEALRAQYERHLTRLRLDGLPEKPRFTFCATDLQFGANWTFERDGSGDYLAGQFRSLASEPVARAVAASSCFPPVFLPLTLALPRSGEADSDRPSVVHLTDGGVYDNLGMQPVWSGRPVVLVSDGGAPFDFEVGTKPWSRLARYAAIATNEVGSLRLQWLLARVRKEEIRAATWRIGNSTHSYVRDDIGGYSKQLARDVVAEIRTDMDGFLESEIRVLENHGYLLAAASTSGFVDDLLEANAPAPRAPHPEWLDEARVRTALAKSSERQYLGSLARLAARPWSPFVPRLPKPDARG